MQPHLAGKLYGIAILDVDRAQRLALVIHAYRFGRKHAIYIEDDGLDLG